MNRIKTLMLAALLVLLPIVGLADDVIIDDFTGDDFVAAIPEPTSALLMGIGLVAVGLSLRHRR
jgi:hypothetical protein